MVALQKMHHLMDQNVHQTRTRFLCELKIQPDTFCSNVTRPPKRFHPLNPHFIDRHTQLWFPFFKEWRHLRPQILAIPTLHHCLPLGTIRTRTHTECNLCIVGQPDLRWTVLLDDLKSITSTRKIVALSGHKLALRLPLLLGEFCLFLPNPCESCDDCHPNRIFIEM